MILKHFMEGGPKFMSAIYILWIAVIILAIRFLIIYSKDKQSIKLKRTNDAILFLGSFTFLLGIFGQIIGFFQVLNVIEREGDIAPCLIAGGLRVSLLAPLYGFTLLLVSAMVWFIFRNLIKK